MNTILMVDDENPFLLSLKDGLTAHNSQLNILLANDGEQALDLLGNNDVDLLVTDLKLPVMDGFQLLAHVSQNNPYMPVIVMTAFGTPDIEEKLANLNALHYLEKPLDFDILVQTIESALSTELNSYIRGITLSTFLQLVHMEKKSCSLTIHAGSETGQLFLREGELIDARCDDLSGKEAALKIIGWDNAEIEMDAICRRDTQTISAPIGFILMEAHRIKDEDNFSSGQGTPPPPAAGSGEIENLVMELPLVRFLRRAPSVKEFAIFNDGNLIEHLSSEPCSLAKLDPAYYLSACQSVGGFMEGSQLNYLLFTTSSKQQYLILPWGGRRIILSLQMNSRAGDLYRELKTILELDSAIPYRRGAHETTH